MVSSLHLGVAGFESPGGNGKSRLLRPLLVDSRLWARRNWIIAGVAAVCLIAGAALSHRVEPGIRVDKVTLAQDTPALRFMPTGAGPHPAALLAHGYAASKETLFRYGEALAAAGLSGEKVTIYSGDFFGTTHCKALLIFIPNLKHISSSTSMARK